jgi:hypothetical protein
MHTHADGTSRLVVPDIYLQTLESVLLMYPECRSIVEFAVNAADEISFLYMITRICHVFGEATWLETLLPFARYEYHIYIYIQRQTHFHHHEQ